MYSRPTMLLLMLPSLFRTDSSPVTAYLKVAQGETVTFLLESVEAGEKLGRYSFIGVGEQGRGRDPDHRHAGPDEERQDDEPDQHRRRRAAEEAVQPGFPARPVPAGPLPAGTLPVVILPIGGLPARAGPAEGTVESLLAHASSRP